MGRISAASAFRNFFAGKFGTGLRALGISPARVERLRRVAGLGTVSKRCSRIGFYGIARFAIRSRLVKLGTPPMRHFAPTLSKKLEHRHTIYLGLATKANHFFDLPNEQRPSGLTSNARKIQYRLMELLQNESNAPQ